ncbi:MAG TPA: hypothetical protein PLS81_04660 [Deltaproteobacteria bacterium]|nr:hypothetical protein [Deltaproteobacteria bacterium]HPP79824.1 hypothetical protein [Deltaproteobacteria bacterium]
MAAGHTETVLSLLESWGSLIEKQEGAIAAGDLDTLESLVRETETIQRRLEEGFSSSNELLSDNRIARLLSSLSERHTLVVNSLSRLCSELASEIKELGRNRSSVGSYKQGARPGPRIMSERT